MKRNSSGGWNRDCGVHALHARFGMSWAGTTRGCCSICGAGDLECTHVPGERYDGLLCFRVVKELVELDEVSVVQFPADPRCYRLQLHASANVVERARGRPIRHDEEPTCTHCLTCTAVARGPLEHDIDQTLWPPPAVGG